MRRAYAVLSVLIVAVLASAIQPTAETHAGEIWTFYTGETYLNAPEPARTLYVAGLSDTLNALADSGDIAAPWVVECTTGQHSSELTAMFDRWLTANPALLGKSAPLLFLVALRANCLR